MRYFKMSQEQAQKIWQSAEKMNGKKAIVVFDILRSLELLPEVPLEEQAKTPVATN